MLMLDGHALDTLPATLPDNTGWIDMLDASPEEIRWVEQQTGLHVPTLADLSEIESSSRLRLDGGTFYLSTPQVFRAASGEPFTSALGFVLNQDRLVTVRFVPLTAFSNFATAWLKPGPGHSGGAAAFVGLLEAVIDRMADVLETVGGELDAMSPRVFSVQVAGPPARESADLRELLRRVGRCGDLASKIRHSLLGVGRIVPYVLAQSADWLPAELRTRLETQRADIASLTDYDTHLSDKVQLLLDATLGLINIEQNNIIKVLTVVSVVGVPPTLIASMYGMNFHNMPELSWRWGYQYGLAMIVLSAVIPLVWFKLRGWR